MAPGLPHHKNAFCGRLRHRTRSAVTSQEYGDGVGIVSLEE